MESTARKFEEREDKFIHEGFTEKGFTDKEMQPVMDMHTDIRDQIDRLADTGVLPRLDKEQFTKRLEFILNGDNDKALQELRSLQTELADIKKEYDLVKAKINQISPVIRLKYGAQFNEAPNLEQRKKIADEIIERDQLRKEYDEKLAIYGSKTELKREFSEWFEELSINGQREAIRNFENEAKPRLEMKKFGDDVLKAMKKYCPNLADELEKALNDEKAGMSEQRRALNKAESDLNAEFENRLSKLAQDSKTKKAVEYARDYFYSLKEKSDLNVNSKLIQKVENLDFAVKAIEKEKEWNVKFVEFQKKIPEFYKLKSDEWDKMDFADKQETIETGEKYEKVLKQYEQAEKEGLMSKATFDKYKSWLLLQTGSVKEINKAFEGWTEERASLKEIYDNFYSEKNPKSVKKRDPEFYKKNLDKFNNGRRSERLKILEQFEKENGVSLDENPVDLKEKEVRMEFAKKFEKEKNYFEALKVWDDLNKKFPEDKLIKREWERVKKLVVINGGKGEAIEQPEGKDGKLLNEVEVKRTAKKVLNSFDIKKEFQIEELKAALLLHQKRNEVGLGQKTGEIRGGAQKRAELRERAKGNQNDVAGRFLKSKKNDNKFVLNEKRKAEKVKNIDFGNTAEFEDANNVSSLREKYMVKQRAKMQSGERGSDELNIKNSREGDGKISGDQIDKKNKASREALLAQTGRDILRLQGLDTRGMSDSKVKERIGEHLLRSMLEEKSELSGIEDVWKKAA